MSRCREIAPLIDELCDGTLDDARARAVRAHMRECPRCARAAEDLEALRSASVDLGAADPPSGMWRALAARLDADDAALAHRPRLWWWWHAWRRQLIGGAAGVALASLALTGFLVARRSQPLEAALRALPHPLASADEIYEEAVHEVARAENDYTAAIRDLRDIVAVERARWRPEVARAFDENLRAIDAAVARQGELARREPGNPVVADALHETYRREIDFLQEAVVRGDTR